jgi:hypothetical protein
MDLVRKVKRLARRISAKEQMQDVNVKEQRTSSSDVVGVVGVVGVVAGGKRGCWCCYCYCSVDEDAEDEDIVGTVDAVEGGCKWRMRMLLRGTTTWRRSWPANGACRWC